MSSEGFVVENEKWCRIAVQRIGRSREREGFGNARDVRNLFETIALKRQSVRIVEERRRGGDPNVKLLLRDDLLGPKASRDTLLHGSACYRELQKMHGLQEVKQAIDRLVSVAIRNAELEEREEPLVELNFEQSVSGQPRHGENNRRKTLCRNSS